MTELKDLCARLRAKNDLDCEEAATSIEGLKLDNGELLRCANVQEVERYAASNREYFAKVERLDAIRFDLEHECNVLRLQVKQADQRGDDAMRRAHACEDTLDYASAWISSVPHGDNCFVSNHFAGDPGNQCNCGKDSALRRITAYAARDEIEADIAENADYLAG